MFNVKQSIYLRSRDVLTLPCYCLFGLNNTLFSIKADENGREYNFGRVSKRYFQDFFENNTKESIECLPEEKRPVLLMIKNPSEFLERVYRFFGKIGISREEVLLRPVTYMDKSIPFVCTEESPFELFLKDENFAHQNEIRIVINTKNGKALQKLSEMNYIVDIGSLEDITSIEGYYLEDMLMELNGKTLSYKLPEPKIHALEDSSKEEFLRDLCRLNCGDNMGLRSEDEVKEAIKFIEKMLKEKHGINYYEFFDGYSHIYRTIP